MPELLRFHDFEEAVYTQLRSQNDRLRRRVAELEDQLTVALGEEVPGVSLVETIIETLVK